MNINRVRNIIEEIAQSEGVEIATGLIPAEKFPKTNSPVGVLVYTDDADIATLCELLSKITNRVVKVYPGVKAVAHTDSSPEINKTITPVDPTKFTFNPSQDIYQPPIGNSQADIRPS